jgi:TolB protein
VRASLQLLLAALLAITLSPLQSFADEASLPPGWKQITHDGDFKQRPVWSPDGSKLMFTRHVGESIRVIQCDADGKNERRLFDNPHARMDAAFFHDGKRLAFTFDKITPGQGDMEIYLADSEGENLQPLFISEGKLSHEEWASPSPDGEWIACTSTRDDNAEIYLVKTDGKEKHRLTSDPALDLHPDFSPDGKKIAFATNRWGDFEIAVYDLESSLITRLTSSPGLDDFPTWSRDGQKIAFTSRRDGNLEIFVMEPDGSLPRNVTQHEGPDNFPAWNPKGGLTFCSFHEGTWDIYQVEVE